MFAKAGISKNVSHALNPDDVAKTVEFLVSMDGTLLLPEVGIKKFPNA